MSSEQLIILTIIFLASLIQSLSGFGMVLVAISLLPAVLDIHIAVPLMVLLSFTMNSVLLLIYRSTFNLRAIAPVIAAAILSLPIGMLAFNRVNEHVFLGGLGLLLVAYAVYALASVTLPELSHSAWAYFFGMVSGILSGAYGIAGPPMIVYGTCKRWKPTEFKANLQGFFIVVSGSLVITHALANHVTRNVGTQYVYALAPLTLGALIGIYLDRYIDSRAFQKLVLLLLIGMGIRLVLSNLL